MFNVSACHLPEDSLLAQFGGHGDYRDCFCREVAGNVSLPEYIERFYCSMAFRPERMVLGLMGRRASSEDARKLARGEINRFGVWEVVERRENEILLESKGTGTASWLAVEPVAFKQRSGSAEKDSSSSAAIGKQTRLLFGSWVGNLEQSGWRIMQRPHQYYSRVLLSRC